MKFLLLAAAAVSWSGVLVTQTPADCIDAGDIVQLTALVERSVVKLETAGQGPECTGGGTGFFVTELGHVLTAGHVIPKDCQDMRISGQTVGLQKTFELAVVEPRSSLDVVLLKPTDDIGKTPQLKLVRPIDDPKKFKLKRVTIASFYKELPEPTLTSARVDSTIILGEEHKWALCAVAANPGRSGSPVILDDGSVVAVFIERPGDQYQDIARVIPIAEVNDIPIIQGTNATVIVDFGSGFDDPLDLKAAPQPVLYEFTISETTSRHPSPFQTQGRYLVMDGAFVPASNKTDFEIAASVLAGAQMRFAEQYEETFAAFPGYKFDTDQPVRIYPVSHAPTAAPLPDRVCSTKTDTDCYQFSDEGKKLTVRFRLFAGPVGDQTRGWLSASVATRQIPVTSP